ncbi:TetR/AcrR family transcriptional regulator [Pontiellaceae bacterium B12219]|nr:TetR/AcrR family transcriptional regulator [Pontiellaceae bacterium B12219]
MKEKTTKERILEAAEELMLEKSFHAVGLKQLLDAVKVPKGSFYHYFESKEQFGAELLRHYMEEGSAFKRSQLFCRDLEPDPLKRLFAYLDGSVDFIENNPGKYPCLAVKLASEVSDLSEAMRKELVAGFRNWVDIYRIVLDEAIEAGFLPKDYNAASEAELIQDHWAGAAQRSVTFRSPEPVRLTVEHIKRRISDKVI